jgi:Ulp1 family protease
LEDEAKTHDVVSFKSKEWQFRAMAKENLASVPQQKNGIDCGVFVCMYAEYLLFDLPLNFSRTDIFFFRSRICANILQQGKHHSLVVLRSNFP